MTSAFRSPDNDGAVDRAYAAEDDHYSWVCDVCFADIQVQSFATGSACGEGQELSGAERTGGMCPLAAPLSDEIDKYDRKCPLPMGSSHTCGRQIGIKAYKFAAGVVVKCPGAKDF